MSSLADVRNKRKKPVFVLYVHMHTEKHIFRHRENSEYANHGMLDRMRQSLSVTVTLHSLPVGPDARLRLIPTVSVSNIFGTNTSW